MVKLKSKVMSCSWVHIPSSITVVVWMTWRGQSSEHNCHWVRNLVGIRACNAKLSVLWLIVKISTMVTVKNNMTKFTTYLTLGFWAGCGWFWWPLLIGVKGLRLWFPKDARGVVWEISWIRIDVEPILFRTWIWGILVRGLWFWASFVIRVRRQVGLKEINVLVSHSMFHPIFNTI